MARFCSRCGKKIGFFEEDFDNMHYNCYLEKKAEDDRLREEEKIRKLEEQKRIEEERKAKLQREEEERKAKLEREEKERIKKEKEDEKKRIQETLRQQAIQRREKQKLQKEKEREKQKIQREKEEKKLEKLRKDKLKNEKKLQNVKRTLKENPFILLTYFEIYSYSKFIKNLTKNNFSDVFFKVLENVTLSLEKEKFVAKINNINFIKKVINEILPNNIDNIYATSSPIDSDTIEKAINYSFLMDYLKDCNPDFYVPKYSSLEEEILADLELKHRYIFDYNRSNDKIILFSYCYYYSILIIYLLIISNDIKKFKNNKDLYKIYSGLISTSINNKYIIDKLYKMYYSFYKDTFSTELSYLDFENIFNFNKLNEMLFQKKFTDNSLKKIKEQLSDFNNINEHTELIQKLVINSIKEKNLDIDKINNNLIRIYYVNLLENIIDNYTTNNLLEIIESLERNIKNTYDCIIAIKLENEKERLLNGDFSIEIELHKQELEYENLQNGYEFEEYVAKLYKMLGYTIEEVTKKSGDQRS